MNLPGRLAALALHLVLAAPMIARGQIPEPRPEDLALVSDLLADRVDITPERVVYVAPGDGPDGTGTREDPRRDLIRVFDEAEAGTAIHLAPGVYDMPAIRDRFGHDDSSLFTQAAGEPGRSRPPHPSSTAGCPCPEPTPDPMRRRRLPTTAASRAPTLARPQRPVRAAAARCLGPTGAPRGRGVCSGSRRSWCSRAVDGARRESLSMRRRGLTPVAKKQADRRFEQIALEGVRGCTPSIP